MRCRHWYCKRKRVNKTKSQSCQKRTKKLNDNYKTPSEHPWLSTVCDFDCFAVFRSLTGLSVPHSSLSGHNRKHPDPPALDKNIPGELEETVPFGPVSSPPTQRSHLWSAAYAVSRSSEVSTQDHNDVREKHNSATQARAPFSRTVSPFIVTLTKVLANT